MAHPFKIMSANGFRPSGVLQIGANNGQEVEAIASSGSRVSILVEPLPGPYGELKTKAMKFPNMTTIQAVCSDKSGDEVTFYVANNAGKSSSILEPKNHLKLYPEIAFLEEIKMESATVDDILAILKSKLGLEIDRIDTLMMDVQGAEHLVVRGAEWTLRKINYLFCEVSYGDLYNGDMPLEEFQKFLSSYGFRLYFLTMTRKGWGDALFVKEDCISK